MQGALGQVIIQLGKEKFCMIHFMRSLTVNVECIKVKQELQGGVGRKLGDMSQVIGGYLGFLDQAVNRSYLWR